MFKANTTSQFVAGAKKKHQSRYDYSSVNYVGTHTKVDILCQEHGAFSQTPLAHLRGQGCPKCKNEKLPGGYSKKFFNKNKQHREIPARIYLVRLENEKESFLKIGITKYTIGSRFCKGKGFKVRSLFEHETTIYEAFTLEQQMIKNLKHLKYKPKTAFAGKTECFVLDAEQQILKGLYESCQE